MSARVLIVGLAPGLHGANKTGRVFTGDQSGELLFATLRTHGFLQGIYNGHADDGLELVDAMITNAVRCVPPANRPTAGEINTCRPYLARTIERMKYLKVVVALGRIAHDTVLSCTGLRKADSKFEHGARHNLGHDRILLDSYHCSRYNINTGRLTPAMFHDVFGRVCNELQ